jgi:secreted trypsin-like serine protease
MRRRPRLALLGALATISLLVPAGASAQSDGSAQPKIVGGSNASISQYPWQAAVVASGSGNAQPRQFCGGSLVTSRIVITAAHCVDGMSPAGVEVVLGRTSLSSGEGTEVAAQALSVQSNYNHAPLFSDIPPRYDVGYIVLSQPSGHARIQIAAAGEAGLWSPGSVEHITGWGCTTPPVLIFDCSNSDHLQAAQVPIIADSTCGSAGVYDGDFDPATMVCAGYLSGGVDTCNGDSGGPLQAPIGGGAYRLVGITSWGEGCAQPNAPGVYTRVAGSAIRPLVSADICAIESANGLAHETVIAGEGSSCAATLAAKKKKRGPFAKCKRIRDKKKRKRCVKKVKRKLKTV